MAVTIRLARQGTKKQPLYRVVAADKERPRNGKFLEVLGTYDPKLAEKKKLNLSVERYHYWLSKGAQSSDTVRELFQKQYA